MKILYRIKAVFYAIIFVLSVLVVVFLMWIFNSKNHIIRQKWAKLQKFVSGYKLIKHGEFQDVDLILINHRSMLDIIILEEIYPKNLSWVAKKEIGQIPVLGKILSLPKMISIDRQNPRSIVSLVKDVKDRLNDGRVIAIFPEGTRSKGDKLLKFHTGAKVVVEKLKLKVQPIVLYDTSKLLDAKDFIQKSGTVSLTCLDTVDTSDENWFENTRKKMQEVYDLEKNRFENGFYA